MLGFMECGLLFLPLVFRSTSAYNLTLFTISIILTIFGRSWSNIRCYYQFKMKLWFRRFSDDGFIYPIVVFPMFFGNYNPLKLPWTDFDAYFYYAVITSLSFAIFGLFICFGPLVVLVSIAALITMIFQTLTMYWCIVSFILMVIYIILFIIIVRHSPNSFTFGEAGLITQIVGFVLMRFFENIYVILNGFDAYGDSEHSQFTFILFGATSITIFILSPILYCKRHWCMSFVDRMVASICFYIGLTLNLIFVFVPAFVYFMKQENVVMWLLQEVIKTQFRLKLVAYWFILTFLSCLVIYWFSSGEKQIPKTVVRKIFHGIAFLIFLPAYKDIEFVAIVTALVFVAFIFVELVRVSNIEPLGELLSYYLEPFREQQDSGPLILTHIYLLSGLSFPVWYALSNEDYKQSNQSMFQFLSIYAGVISLCVGDTFASVIGKSYGTRTWPSRSKTYKGTVGCVISMLTFGVFFILYFQFPVDLYQIILMVVLCICVSLLESISNQVDNLILPIYTLLLCKSFQ